MNLYQQENLNNSRKQPNWFYKSFNWTDSLRKHFLIFLYCNVFCNFSRLRERLLPSAFIYKLRKSNCFTGSKTNSVTLICYRKINRRREEWPSELRGYIRIGRFLVQASLGARPGIGTNLITRLPVTFR